VRRQLGAAPLPHRSAGSRALIARGAQALLLCAALAAGAVYATGREPPAEETTRSSRGSSAVQRSAPRTVASLAPPVVAVDPQRALGSADARVAIVEFADYQCPYCRSFHLNAFARLKERYIDTGRVRFYYMDFPLAHHVHALSASVAARCAGRQSRYWDMQQRLYAEQARLGDALYARLAEELGLDTERFEACRRSNEARAAVERDLIEGRRLGVRGTPTFIVGRIVEGGVKVERMAFGVPTFETFADELELLLE